jgi:hypothetical protein
VATPSKPAVKIKLTIIAEQDGKCKVLAGPADEASKWSLLKGILSIN